jgi:hypothetical protein
MEFEKVLDYVDIVVAMSKQGKYAPNMGYFNNERNT